MSSPGLSVLHTTPSRDSGHSSPRSSVPSTFIGFSWGPTLDAFPDHPPMTDDAANPPHDLPPIMTPRPLKSVHPLHTPQIPFLSVTNPASQPFVTPIRPNTLAPPHSLPRTSTSRRTAPRRSVSDREAMQQLVDCVGMSARKKVLESGRKPRWLASISRSGTVKELRFAPVDDDDSDSDNDNDDNDDANVKHDPSRLGSLLPMLSGSEDTDTEGPPSPSPSPRPGSVLSRRSATPTTTMTFSQRTGSTILSSSKAISGRSGRPNRDHIDDGAPHEDGIRLSVLEEKHALLMRDISDIERRLGHLSMLVGVHD